MELEARARIARHELRVQRLLLRYQKRLRSRFSSRPRRSTRLCTLELAIKTSVKGSSKHLKHTAASVWGSQASGRTVDVEVDAEVEQVRVDQTEAVAEKHTASSFRYPHGLEASVHVAN